MKPDIIHSLTKNFESFAHKTEDGLEFWFARDLQKLLGYLRWENFVNAINKAKIACEVFGEKVSDHFPDITKSIPVPKGGVREIEDIMLTRYACYLIAQNGDPSKEEIAFAQISVEHVTNNKSVRSTLISRGVVPEKLPALEDVKKVERKVKDEKKKELKKITKKK